MFSLVFLLTACAGAGEGPGSTVGCGDAAFRAQDEELYVTETAISNAIGRAGDPATLLLDLRRARTALTGYLDGHPPCAPALRQIAAAERGALAALDGGIAALEVGADARDELARALDILRTAERSLRSRS